MLFSIVTSDLGSKILSSIVDIINPVLNDLTVHANYINLPDHFSGKKNHACIDGSSEKFLSLIV